MRLYKTSCHFYKGGSRFIVLIYLCTSAWVRARQKDALERIVIGNGVMFRQRSWSGCEIYMFDTLVLGQCLSQAIYFHIYKGNL